MNKTVLLIVLVLLFLSSAAYAATAACTTGSGNNPNGCTQVPENQVPPPGNPTNSGPMGGNGNGGGLEELEELEEEEEVVLEYTEEFTAGPATTSLRPLPILINGTYLCSTTCPEWAIKKSSPTGTAVCTCGSLSKPLILYRPRPLGAGLPASCLTGIDLTNQYALTLAEVNQVKNTCNGIGLCGCPGPAVTRPDLAKMYSIAENNKVTPITISIGNTKAGFEAVSNPGNLNVGNTQLGSQISGGQIGTQIGGVANKAIGGR